MRALATRARQLYSEGASDPMTTQPVRIPVSFARRAVRATPPPVLGAMITVLMNKMRARHPRLFDNLERLAATTILVEVIDLPHRFVLRYGQGPASLALAGAAEVQADAKVRGDLETLISLLEGRIDSDTLFFTRDLEITGDTSVVVGLRNTLDREEINLLDDIAAFGGPLAAPIERTVAVVDGLVQRGRGTLARLHADLHREHEADRDLAAECESLRTELQALKARLAKFEARARRVAVAKP